MNSPSIKLNNNLIRQIVRISSSGEKIRIKFSNILCEKELKLKKFFSRYKFSYWSKYENNLKDNR